MDQNKKNDRIYVMPNRLRIGAAAFVCAFTLIAAITNNLLDNSVRLVLAIILSPGFLLLLFMLYCRKIIAGSSGIVIHRFWRPTVRIRYRQITKIEVTFFWRTTYLDFFREQECLGRCYSTDTNFARLLSLLTKTIPERIEYVNFRL